MCGLNCSDKSDPVSAISLQVTQGIINPEGVRLEWRRDGSITISPLTPGSANAGKIGNGRARSRRRATRSRRKCRSKPSCDKIGLLVLQVYVPSWIAAERDRPQRVRIIQTIMEQIKTEEQLDAKGWTPKYVEAKLKKLAAATRNPKE